MSNIAKLAWLTHLSIFPRDSPVVLIENTFLKCVACGCVGGKTVIQHSPLCVLVVKEGPVKYYRLHGVPTHRRGAPIFNDYDTSVREVDDALREFATSLDRWQDPRRAKGRQREVDSLIGEAPGATCYMAEEAFRRANYWRPDALEFVRLWLAPEFEKPEHDELVGICMALYPIESLKTYPLMWVVDFLHDFVGKKEVLKVRLIDSVRASCARVREASDKKSKNRIDS